MRRIYLLTAGLLAGVLLSLGGFALWSTTRDNNDQKATHEEPFCDLYEIGEQDIPRSGPHREMATLELLASAAQLSPNSRIAHYGDQLLSEIERYYDPSDELHYQRADYLGYSIDSVLDAWASECR